jgi:excisionase family DNA binding protein
MEKLLLRPAEAAETLGLGRSKTYQLIASGIIPSLRIGKSVRVPTEALRQWAKAQAKAGQEGREGG